MGTDKPHGIDRIKSSLGRAYTRGEVSLILTFSLFHSYFWILIFFFFLWKADRVEKKKNDLTNYVYSFIRFFCWIVCSLIKIHDT